MKSWFKEFITEDGGDLIDMRIDCKIKNIPEWNRTAAAENWVAEHGVKDEK